jgi:Zn-dependent protease
MCLTLRHKAHPPRPRLGEYEPHYYAYGARPRRRVGFHTSGTEILHIAVALAVLTVAFGFFIGGYMLRDDGLSQGASPWVPRTPLPDLFLIALVAIGSGFVLHELMHKFVAQFYGHWAEFRAQLFGLLIPIPLVLFLGFIFAAPGAVIISGAVRKNENGIISAAGPLTNLIIGAIAYPFTLQVGAVDTLGYHIATVALFANAILALFNLIPLGPLDGKKVLAWNKPVYFLLVAAGLVLLLLGLRIPL